MSSTTDQLSKLPTEINVNFLCRLDFRSLLACREVSRLLRTIVDGTAALQYIIALGASGLRVGSLVGPDMGSSECMAMLDKYNTAWRNLEWTEHKILTETRDMETKWHLSGGVWAQLDESETAIHFYQLPSHLRGIKERQWVLQFDVKVETFNMDPSQDLLVLVHSKPLPVANHRFRYDLFITLRSLSTGDVHPMAVEAQGDDYHVMLEVPVGQGFLSGWWPLQVSGNNIGLLAIDDVCVCNWKTGVQKVFRKSESFVFLDSDHILVLAQHQRNEATPGRVDLSMYSLRLDAPEEHLDGRGTDARKSCSCSFVLPSSMLPTSIYEDGIDISPISCPAADEGVPFSTSHDDSLVAIHFMSVHGGSKYCLFVRARTLLSYVRDTPDAVGREVPWADWGPESGGTCLVTRITNEDQYLPRKGSVRGMRYLWHHNDEHVVRLWDFYTTRTKRCDDPSFIEDVDGGETGKRGHPMDKQLLYTQRQVALPPEFQTRFPVYLLLGEDSIVAFPMDQKFWGGFEIHVLTF